MSNTAWDDLLHPMSLGMCTENLGCETGTIIDYTFATSSEDIEDECLQHLRDWPCFSPERVTGLTSKYVARGKEIRRSYPPPLTSIDRLEFMSSREDGRLLIRAVPTYTSIRVERSDGRLLIRLPINAAPAPPTSLSSQDDEEYNVEEYVNEDDTCIEDELSREGGEEEDDDDNMVDEVLLDDDEDGSLWLPFFDQNYVEHENSHEENNELGSITTDQMFVQKPTRCKEGGHENKGFICNWRTFCVAGS